MQNRMSAHEYRAKGAERFSRLSVSGLDPRFDYSFQRISDVQEGVTADGWEMVSEQNHNGERFGGPEELQRLRRAGRSIIVGDVVLCRRTKNLSKYFKQLDDEKYNAHAGMVMSVASRTRQRLRSIDPDNSLTTLKDESDVSAVKQRVGPTIEENEATDDSQPRRPGRPRKLTEE